MTEQTPPPVPEPDESEHPEQFPPAHDARDPEADTAAEPPHTGHARGDLQTDTTGETIPLADE